MTNLTCSNCTQSVNISKHLELARKQERYEIEKKAIPEKAKKNATARTFVGLYVSNKNSEMVKAGIAAAAILPYNWAKGIENVSDNGVNWTLKKMPACLKSNLGKLYLAHSALQAKEQSIPYITPMVNTVELAIGFKLGIQGHNRAEDILRESKEAGSLPKKIIAKASATASTMAFGHMITKSQNCYAGVAGATTSATVPVLAEKVLEKVDSTMHKIPSEVSAMMCVLYGVHEVYFQYFAGTVPYVTEAVAFGELTFSFIAGMKYFMHSKKQSEESLTNDLPKIKEIE